MTALLKEFEAKYGAQAAKDAEELIVASAKESASRFEAVEDAVLRLVSMFGISEMVSATELQKWSFGRLLDELNKRHRLVLLYKSAPSAVVLDRESILEIEEDLRSAKIAGLLADYEPRRLLPADDFWASMGASAPKA